MPRMEERIRELEKYRDALSARVITLQNMVLTLLVRDLMRNEADPIEAGKRVCAQVIDPVIGKPMHEACVCGMADELEKRLHAVMKPPPTS